MYKKDLSFIVFLLCFSFILFSNYAFAAGSPEEQVSTEKSITGSVKKLELETPQKDVTGDTQKDKTQKTGKEQKSEETSANKESPALEKVSIKKVELLSRVNKLGDKLKVDLEIEKPVKGNFPVKLYLKDAEGKTVVSSVVKDIDFKGEKVKYNESDGLVFEVSESIPISSFWPDDATPHMALIKIGDSEEKNAGTIRLYKKTHIISIKDGIALPGFHIPFYVLLMALLGGLGYVVTSIYKKPEFTRKNIWKWFARLLLSLFFGIFLYSISTIIVSPPNAYIIGALCFASSFYISPIQAKMRDFVYEKLASDKKLEDDIAELEADEAELISRLSMSKRAAYFLKKEGITSVADLSAASDDKLKSLAKSLIDEGYLLNKKAEAKVLDGENIYKLKMPLELKNKLLLKEIKYLRDLVNLDISKIDHISSDEKDMLNNIIKEAKAKPTITSIEPPDKAKAGDTITIKGTAFGCQTGKVLIGTIEIKENLTWCDSIILIKVPDNFKPDKTDICVETAYKQNATCPYEIEAKP